MGVEGFFRAEGEEVPTTPQRWRGCSNPLILKLQSAEHDKMGGEGFEPPILRASVV